MNKNMIEDNMLDDEIRVLGSGIEPKEQYNMSHESKQRPHKKTFSHWVVIVLLVLFASIGISYLSTHIFSFKDSQDNPLPVDTLSVETLKDSVSTGPSYTIISDTTINDIPLCIFTPIGGRVGLSICHHIEKEKDVILAAHAANLRADDGTPAGAFVYNGELLSKGHSKYGFCAIVDGTVSIGRQIETPLFERAIEQNGCFFRQYSIVSNSKLVSVPPKGKSVRRALCLKNNVLMIIESGTPESFHDFSQALEDFGVSEALALVGSDAAVIWRDKKGHLTYRGVFGEDYPMENYIVWRK